jgi:hypothetical protein
LLSGTDDETEDSACIVVSTCDYGCLWQGDRRAGPADREDIRAALEFGANLVAYARQRRAAKGDSNT